jgi:plastocyanin
MKRLALVLSVLALAGGGLAACGGGDDDETTEAATGSATTTTTGGGGGGGGGGGTIDVEADPGGQLAFTETEISAPAGDDTVNFNNPSSVGHDVVIEDADGNEVARTDVITDDQTSTTANLKAGEYTYFCSVDGHRAAGMEGTLTVK